MSIFETVTHIFNPAPHAEPIKDDKEVDSQYTYWRLRIFYSMYIGYAIYYFTRKSFTFATTAMKHELGLDEVQIGLIGTVFAIAYGISKFTCGVLSDRSNPRFFMGIGLFMTGVMNIFFGFSTTLTWLMIFWGLNGWFQGTGWPPSARLLTHWYSQRERGRWWGVWNTSHNLGGALIPIIATYYAQKMGWNYALFVPGAIGIATGAFLLNRLRDTPQSMGLPCIEKHHKKTLDNNTEEVSIKEEKELTVKEILLDYVLNNRYVWILAFAYFCIYIVRQAVNDWTLLYLTEEKGFTQLSAGTCLFWFEIGGFFGSLVAGWGSDILFKGRRGPVNAIFSVVISVVVLGMCHFGGESLFLNSLFIFLIGFAVFGPQMLIGVHAAELSHKKAAATATGFAGLFAYLGAATAGFPLGMVIRDYGWQSFFNLLAICGVAATILLLPLWSATKNPKAS